MPSIGLPAICKKTGYGKIQPQKPGGMAEWFKAPVLKTGMVKAIVGSNPSPSACYESTSRFAIWGGAGVAERDRLLSDCRDGHLDRGFESLPPRQ
jgi:hypothetical protein